MHLAQTIRKYLGWCPNAQEGTRTLSIQPCDETVSPSAGGSFKARAMNWLGLFRNQIMVLALYFSVVGVLLSVFMGGIDIPMFFIGLVAGSLLSVFQGIRFWKTMNEVRESGAVFLAALYDKTTISFGAIPGITMPMSNSITGGFIFMLFWWFLLITWIWESQTKRNLLSDGLMLSLARDS
jgi:Protein of unknown function (DUF1673)